MTAGTTYCVRAYATNSVGTSYGSEVSFATSGGGGGGGGGGSTDSCPSDPAKTSPGVCGCGVADTDADGDGTLDCNDACPDDIDKSDAGVCGCGTADTDGDGTPDCTDDCPGNPDKTEPGLYGCNGESTADENQTAEVNNDVVDAVVEGLEEGGEIVVITDDAGTTTLTTTDSNGESVLTVSIDGLDDGARIDVTMDESGNPSVTITDAGGATLTVNVGQYPAGIEVYSVRDDQGRVVVSITDDSEATDNVIVELLGSDRDIVITVTYNYAEQEAGQTVPGSDGTLTVGGDAWAAADSVTLETVGLLGSAEITVAVEYWEADPAEGEESALRLYRLDEETGQYVPCGTNDEGGGPPTKVLGDFGIDTEAKSVWAAVDELGTFAVEMPTRETLPETVEPDEIRQACGAGMCGALGVLCLPMTALTLMAMRRRRW